MSSSAQSAIPGGADSDFFSSYVHALLDGALSGAAEDLFGPASAWSMPGDAESRRHRVMDAMTPHHAPCQLPPQLWGDTEYVDALPVEPPIPPHASKVSLLSEDGVQHTVATPRQQPQRQQDGGEDQRQQGPQVQTSLRSYFEEMEKSGGTAPLSRGARPPTSLESRIHVGSSDARPPSRRELQSHGASDAGLAMSDAWWRFFGSEPLPAAGCENWINADSETRPMTTRESRGHVVKGGKTAPHRKSLSHTTRDIRPTSSRKPRAYISDDARPMTSRTRVSQGSSDSKPSQTGEQWSQVSGDAWPPTPPMICDARNRVRSKSRPAALGDWQATNLGAPAARPESWGSSSDGRPMTSRESRATSAAHSLQGPLSARPSGTPLAPRRPPGDGSGFHRRRQHGLPPRTPRQGGTKLEEPPSPEAASPHELPTSALAQDLGVPAAAGRGSVLDAGAGAHAESLAAAIGQQPWAEDAPWKLLPQPLRPGCYVTKGPLPGGAPAGPCPPASPRRGKGAGPAKQAHSGVRAKSLGAGAWSGHPLAAASTGCRRGFDVV